MEPPSPDPNPLYLVWQLVRRVDPLVDAAVGELSAGDFGLYSLLRYRGPLTPSAITARTGSPSSTVSQHVGRLVRRGHLVQRPNPDDARSQLVELTDAGVAAHEQASPGFVALLDRLRAALGDDEEVVVAALVRLDEALRDVGSPADRVDEPTPLDQDARPPLTAAQRDELDAFEDYLRWRDRQRDVTDARQD